jgi:hypothetical protein
VALVSASEQFDFTTPMGRVMLTMLAAFAQWYLDNLSAETAKGKRARAEAGLWNSAVPFGYRVAYKKDGGDGLAYPDEDAVEGVKMAFQAQRARQRRRRKGGYTANKTSRVYPLTGVARCARCGGRVRGANSAGYRYYRDPAHDKGLDCDQGMIAADDVEDALGDFLRQLSLPQDWQERVLGMIQERVGAQQDVARERARIEGQLERLKRLFVLGDVAEAEYRAERDRLQAQLVALTPPAMPDLEWAAELLQDFGRIWDAATPQERQKIVHTLLETVYLDAERGPVVAIEPRADFAAVRSDDVGRERQPCGGSGNRHSATWG